MMIRWCQETFRNATVECHRRRSRIYSLIAELIDRSPLSFGGQAELAADFIERAFLKKKAAIKNVRFATLAEGRCSQMLHPGSYDDEPASVAKVEARGNSQGPKRASKVHREIYPSDARKLAPEKLKTILRFRA